MAKRKVPVEHLISEDIRLVLPEKPIVLPEKPIVLPEKPIILPRKPIVLPSIIPQRKGKKRKEKERKEKESKEKNILTTTTTIACAREEFSLKSYHEELANENLFQRPKKPQKRVKNGVPTQFGRSAYPIRTECLLRFGNKRPVFSPKRQ